MAGPPPHTPSGKPQGLSRRRRITRSAEFDEAYGQGRKYVGRFMVMWLREGPGASLRLGVVTGRKVGGAVQRVRARRRLREAYRRHRAGFAGERDVVLAARAAILRATWDELVGELLTLARRAGICGTSL